MHLKKVIIIGRGQVGTALKQGLVGYDIVDWTGDIAELGIDDLREVQPHAVINAAGKTDLAWCEANAREAVRCNLEAPVELYRRILAHNLKSKERVRYIHFSSGCIWDGPYDEKNRPFTPLSPMSPACLYAYTKAACDLMLQNQATDNLAILRPRQVYSSLVTPRNTISKLLRYPGLIDTPNSMSSANIIVRTTKHLLDSLIDWQGLWSLYDRGFTTPYQVGIALAEAGLRDMPEKITKDALDTWHRPKRVDVVLYDARFERILKPEPVEVELEHAIEGYREAIDT